MDVRTGDTLHVTEAVKASPDPAFTRLYEEGAAHVVGSDLMPLSLAQVFVREGWGYATMQTDPKAGRTEQKTLSPPSAEYSVGPHVAGGYYRLLCGGIPVLHSGEPVRIGSGKAKAETIVAGLNSGAVAVADLVGG